jgi:N utilization substance protein B
VAGRRSQARRFSMLAIYEWQVTGKSAREIERHFFDDPVWMDEVATSLGEGAAAGAPDDPRSLAYDAELFSRLVRGVSGHVQQIDALLQPLLDRPVAQVDPVERAILRLGAFELLHCPEVPYRVVINEAVDLAKGFGAEQGHRYINGVLDQVARAVRPSELGRDTAAG